MRPPGSVATINDVTTASTLRPSTKKFINPREILAENRRTTTSVPGATTSTTFLLNSESDVIFNYNKTNEINELLIVGDGESVKLKKNCLLKRSDSNYGSGKLEIVPKTITPSTSSIKSVSSVVSPEVAELNLHKKNNSNRFSYCGSDNGSGNITEFNFKLPDRNLCNVHLNYDYDDDDAADIIDSGSSIIDNDCIDCDLGGLCMNSACEVLFSTSGNSLGSHIKSQRIRTNFEHDQQQQKFITTANNSWKDHSHHSHSPHLNFNHAHPLGPSITTIIPPISKKSNQNPAACSVPIASYAASNNVVNNKLNKIKRVSSENGFIVHSPTAPIPATVAAINEVPKTKTTNIYVNNLNLINNFHHQQGIPASVVVRNKKLVTPVTDKETILTKRSNNQSLIYARKDLGPVERQIIQQKKQENRRSLQLNIFDGDQLNSNKLQPSPPAAPLLSRQSNRHSWYAATNSYETLFEDFEQEIKDSSIRHNLAGLDSHQLNGLRESASLLEPTIVQSRSQQRRSGARIIPSHTIQEGPHAASLGGPAPRIRRIEQLFKSLVGKKTPSTTNNGATTAPPPTTAASSSSSSSSISTDLSTKIKKDLPKQQIIVTQPSPQKQPSSIVVYENHPELRIDHKSPSEQNLCRDKRKISNSTTSLNSVQQKLWTVMPLLKRDTSCISLSNNNHQQLQQSSLSSSSSSQSVIKNSQNVKHSGYCRGDSSGDDDGVGKNIGLRKSETVIALSQSSNQLSEPIRPLNRLRNSASVATCSRCSSLLSLAAGSRYSLNVSNAGFVTLSSTSEAGSHNSISATAASASASVSGPNGAGSRGILNDGSLSRISLTASVTAVSTHLTSINDVTFTCKLCLGEVKSNQLTKITQCGCSFCTECMKAYMEFEILEGAYEISCPDAMCPAQGIISITEISILVPSSLLEKHHRYRLNREVEMDKNRTWCPKAGCETVCLVDAFSSDRTMMAIQSSPSTLLQVPCSVHCPTCRDDFCSGCKKPWHPTMTCEENTRRLAADGQDDGIGIPFDSDLIKCCPMCAVPIEKDEGCAQMMCKRCKHVFCWYCLASLDDDFLLRHYDKGPCKNKLGHSRASVVWHRAQVIGIFAGFGILLLVASPLLLLAAPCIVCCKCRICSGAAKLEDQDGEFDDAIALQRLVIPDIWPFRLARRILR